MKTKRIVALALTAAMAVSMVSTTAFAAKWSEFEQKTKSDDKKTETTFWAVAYQTQGKDTVKYYMLQEADLTVEKEVTGGEIHTVKSVSKKTADVKGENTADVKFSEIKGNLDTPANVPESDVKVVGWAFKTSPYTADTPLPETQDLSKVEEIMKDDANIADAKYGAPTDVRVFAPVYQKKNVQDKIKDANEIAARPKIAKVKGDKGEWKYTEQEIQAVKSADKASSAGGKEDCEKCNTTTGKSLVYDVKPIAKENGKEVELRTSKKPQIEVILPVTNLLTADEKGKDIDEQVKALKDQIKNNKDNQLKVFHIGSDGKSHPVKFEVVKARPTGASSGEPEVACVKFKYGSFSDFVITRDKDAKAQAGEEEGASGGNPATGEASALPVAMLALAALSATGVVAYKKRKAE